MIYFARVEKTGIIKIGASKHVESRLRSLSAQLKSPMTLLGVCDGSFTAEKSVHQMFDDDCAGGEFFVPSERLIEFISNLANFQPPAEKPRTTNPFRMSVEVSPQLRDRIKSEAKRVRRFSMDEAAILIQEALDARNRKGGKK